MMTVDNNSSTTNLNDLQDLITAWAEDRGIHDHSTPAAQLLKAFSEMGEIADAEIKGDVEGQIDGVGDVVVCLINYAAMNGFTLAEAVSVAYTEIKDRKGRMVEGGAFVKEDDD